MWNIQKATPLDIDEIVKTVPVSFFSSSISLNTFLNHDLLSLWIAERKDEKRIISYRERPGGFGRDARILFYKKDNDDELIKTINDVFKPEIIVYNLLQEPISSELINQELIIDISKIVSLEDKNIRNKFKSFERKYPSVFIKEYNHKEDHQKVSFFLEKWKNTRSSNQNSFARIENDLFFLNNYGSNKAANGIIICDNDAIIGVGFFIEQTPTTCIGIINKILRGYSQLGVFTFVSRAKLMKEKGFIEANIGSVNDDFKKTFLSNGRVLNLYAHIQFKSEKFQAGHWYLNSVVR